MYETPNPIIDPYKDFWTVGERLDMTFSLNSLMAREDADEQNHKVPAEETTHPDDLKQLHNPDSGGPQ